MLVCSCGWKGVNLVPCEEDDTARCPSCYTVFVGIAAKDAVVVSPSEEAQTVRESEALMALAEALFRKDSEMLKALADGDSFESFPEEKK